MKAAEAAPRRGRALSIGDLYTRECVDLVPALRLRAYDVVAMLSRLRDEHGILAVTKCDNGTAFTSVGCY